MLDTIDQIFAPPAAVDETAAGAFFAQSESTLAAIRSGLLIFLQDTRAVADLDGPIRNANALNKNARSADMDNIAVRSALCERLLLDVLEGRAAAPQQNARRALDILAEIETLILDIPLQNEDPLFSVSGFVDESFAKLTNGLEKPDVEPVPEAAFEIDEETLEIFQGEASELLENISINLRTLTSHPDDRDALWNIRRCAHTFKGAAGVVGLTEASRLAHRVEDLLDRLAEQEGDVSSSVLGLLAASTDHLDSMARGSAPPEPSKTLDAIYIDFDRVMSGRKTDSATDPSSAPSKTIPAGTTSDPIKPPPAPIVRVALDKLDDLLELTRNMAVNRSELAAQCNDMSHAAPLFDAQRKITEEIQERLLHIRMVRFGMLTTRLNRAVHVTCQEENKKVDLVIENENCEIDTQILDSLVEPLLHLLRNAVVHGIEPPERRRLIGKGEKGEIRIRIDSCDNTIVLSVNDDGGGISIAKLREKAISSGLIDSASARSLSDEKAIDLIFHRGLTTADKLSLNAGRGVGMSIVRESIGSIGGSISIATEPQAGTTFTITIPVGIDLRPRQSVDDMGDKCLTNASRERENGLHILIVDDSSSMRQVIKRIVESAGWNGVTATDGLKALEILGNEHDRFDVILTDLEMPNLNGYELLEAVKENDRHSGIPVVMITSRTDKEHRKKALGLGAVEFLSKPFDANVLIQIIERACGVVKPAT